MTPIVKSVVTAGRAEALWIKWLTYIHVLGMLEYTTTSMLLRRYICVRSGPKQWIYMS